MDSPAGEYCKECDPGVGCRIYDTAPEKCLEFKCAYNQMERVSINLRPDKCGIIFERLDDIMIGTIDNVILNDDAGGQLESFKKEGFSLVLYREHIEPYVWSEKYTREEILEKIQKELKKLNGSS